MVERIIVGPLHTNTYLVSTGKKECILIDPGDDADVIIERLDAVNMIPTAIIFTHGHLDHTSAANAIIEHYKDRVSLAIGIHADDSSFLGRNARQVNRAAFRPFGKGAEAYFETTFRPLPKVTFFFEENDQLLDSDLSVIHTPGHTPGSVSFYSEQRGYVFTGDTLYFKGIGKTDFHKGNKKDIMDSITNKLFKLPSDTRLFPGHGPNSTIERESEHNRFSTDHAMM